MKQIVLVLFVLLCVCNVEAKERKFPKSQPEKSIYVGMSTSTNPLSMFDDAITGAIIEYLRPILEKDDSAEREVSGNFDLEFLKSEIIKEKGFFVWLKITPGGIWNYEAKVDMNVTGISNALSYEYSGTDYYNIEISYAQGEEEVVWETSVLKSLEGSMVSYDDGTRLQSGNVKVRGSLIMKYENPVLPL